MPVYYTSDLLILLSSKDKRIQEAKTSKQSVSKAVDTIAVLISRKEINFMSSEYISDQVLDLLHYFRKEFHLPITSQ